MMIAFVRGDTLIIGLDPGNLDHMREGNPLGVDLRKYLDMAPDWGGAMNAARLIIFSGKNEEEMMATIKEKMNLDMTKSEIIDARLPKH